MPGNVGKGEVVLQLLTDEAGRHTTKPDHFPQRSHCMLSRRSCGQRPEALRGYGQRLWHHSIQELYTCMVDVLARASQLSKILQVAKTTPFQADAVDWKCFSRACQNWNNLDLELGREAFEHGLRLDPNDAAKYMLMCTCGLLPSCRARQTRSRCKN